jgi:hypothetical protein
MKIGFYAASLAVAMVCCASAHAQDVRTACKADREKFCAGQTPGDGSFRACMDSHQAELSAECRSARQVAREAWKKIEADCKPDMGKFCGNAGEERSGLAKCLESHAGELQPACAASWKSRPGANRS